MLPSANVILVSALLCFAQFYLPRVTAQDTNVATCVSEFSWTIDALGNTPCLTAAFLYMPCGTRKFLQMIPAGFEYFGPDATEADECSCSSAVYMLTSACGACQGRPWVNYTFWTQNCSAADTAIGYPKEAPQGVTLPGWARMNVTEMPGQAFDPDRARMLALAETASAPTPTATSTASSTPPVSPSTVSVDETSAASGNAEKSHTNAGAIAGGVVGALIFLTLLSLLLFWRILRKRRPAKKALDLTAPGPHNRYPHDSEKSAAGGSTIVGGMNTPPPVSMIGGLSWHSQELRETPHERQSSTRLGGQGLGYVTQTVNSAGFPEPGTWLNTDQRNTVESAATIDTTHDRQRSVNGFNVPVSEGGMGNATGPVRGQTIYRNENIMMLVPTGYTGAAEVSGS